MFRRPLAPTLAFPFAVTDTSKTARDLLSPDQLRATLAFAEAMLPGSSTIPAADETTVDRVASIFGGVSPAIVKGFAAAQQALDKLAIVYKGRRFQALSATEQQELLRTWGSHPALRGVVNAISFVYKFVHFDTEHAYGALGGRLKVVQDTESPRWLRQAHRAEDWADGDTLECEVVVVGTGAGGGVVGRELADRGYAVVFVEEGDLHRRSSFDGSFVKAQTTFYRNAFALGNSPMPTFMGRLVGGSTAVNGGTCIRTPSWILDGWCDELGTDELSPSAMEPHFERVERLLPVEVPERRYIGPIADVFDRGAKALGWHAGPIARNAVGCEGGGFCDFGCASGAKRSTDVSYVPAALEKGSVLLTGLRAERVILENGRAVGIEGVAKNGRRLKIRGRAVILAGGAIPTPLFLLKQGLCNESGQVGRNLTLHPSGGFTALFEQRMDPQKYIPQAYLCDQFLRDGLLILSAQPDSNIAPLMFPWTGHRLVRAVEELPHLAGFGILVRDSSRNGRVWRDVKGLPLITYNLQPADVDLLHQGMLRAAELALAAGAKRLYPTVIGIDPIENADDLLAFRRMKLAPSQFALTSYHMLGTCKMGRDRKTSVVDLSHQTHEVPGLYIVDGSTVPGPLGVNSQLTIMAMATRAAGKIAEALA